MNLKYLPKLLWILLLPVFYLLQYLSELNAALSFLALLPYLICIGIYISVGRLTIKPENYVLLFLFMISNWLHFYNDSNITGMVSSPALFLFLLTTLNTPGLNLDRLNNVVKRLMLGFIIMFLFIIYLPLLAHFSYTLASWYYVASDTLPIVRTTLDGPFSLVSIAALIYILLKYRPKRFLLILIYIMLLAIIFYTLLVFNRRTLIAYFVISIPFIFRSWYAKPFIYKILFALSFLMPIYFSTFLLYANVLAKIPIVHQLTLRSGDLDPEDNQRLTGWIKALTAFRDSGLRDFFKFHEVLVRSKIDRYNHFHNGYIQMYYEQGIFGFAITLMLLISVITKIKYYKSINFKRYKYLMLPPVMFGLVLILCVTESVFRNLILTNIIFIVSCFLIIKTSQTIRTQNIQQEKL